MDPNLTQRIRIRAQTEMHLSQFNR
jgi:hypothetical protein